MLLKEIQKFKKRNFTFEIKQICSKDISSNYIKALNTNQFVRYNARDKITKRFQIDYINKHNKSSNEIIIGLFNNKKLVGTCGAQKKSKKKFYIGIFIFDKKFIGLKLSKILISFLSHYLKKRKSVSYIYASVNRKNLISHNLFNSLGFKKNFREKKKYKSDVVYFIKNKNLIKFTNLISN